MQWHLYYTIEPFGEERGDRRVAELTALTANINRKKGRKPYRAEDFMPYTESKPRVAPLTKPSEWRTLRRAVKRAAVSD